MYLDSSDYIGCFMNNDLGINSEMIQHDQMKPCYCIGYCRSLNFTLAGIYG